MAGRIVLFGATGFTGELTARELAGRGDRPVLAGRDEARVRALAAELGGLDWAVADVGRPESVAALVGRGDVLVSTVGPFSRWGAPAVEAALAAGAHYVDSAGESPFIRRVFETWGPRAVAAGCTLLTAMGFDWVPGNLAGALALREAGEAAVALEIGYFPTGAGLGPGGLSGGTRASTAGVALEPGFALRGGRMVAERGARRVRAFSVGTRERKAFSAAGSEHFALPQSFPQLRDVDVYLGFLDRGAEAVRVASAATATLARVPGVQALLTAGVGRVVKGSTGGPDAAVRSRTGSHVVAEARDADGDLVARVALEGANIYDFTAAMLAWSAHAAAAGRLRVTGAAGPVAAFGLDALADGVRAAGLQRI